MKKFITASDVAALARKGKTEYVIGPDHRLTDLARETAQKHGNRLIRETVSSAAQPAFPPRILSAPPVKAQPAPMQTPAGPPPVVSVTSRYDMVVENGTVLLPEAGRLPVNLCIRDGKIAALTTEPVSASSRIDASGLYVLPGIVDPHTHLGLFAPLETELETETRSALLGGVTTIGTFFNRPDSYLSLIDFLEEQVPNLSHTDIFPHLTLREEAQLAELPLYSARGMNSYKVYMCGIPGLFPHQEDGFIVRCMEKLSRLPADPILCVHAENASIVEYAEASLAAPPDTLKAFAGSHPNLSEGEAVVRTAYLSKALGFRTYLVHTSCRESMEALRTAKHEKLFVETTSPYLSLDTESDVGVYGKMLPPFRAPKDRKALWDGIRTGIIDTIGTDNTTITCEEKQVAGGMASALAGYPALGTHLVSVLNEGFFRQEIPLEKLIPLMTMNPAKIFGIYPRKGTLLPGSDADVVLVDMNLCRTAEPAGLQSRSDFSLFQGKTLRAWPLVTIKGGRIAARDGRLADDSPSGRVLKHGML